MIETTKERARMDTTRHQGRRFARWRSPTGMAALCTSVVLSMGAAAGAATAPPAAAPAAAWLPSRGPRCRCRVPPRDRLRSAGPDHDVLRDRHRDPEAGGGRGLPDGDRHTVEEAKTTVAARSITISKPTSSGTCAAGPGGAGGFGGGAGARGGFGGFGGGAGERAVGPVPHQAAAFPGVPRAAQGAHSALGASRSPAAR